MVSTQTQTANQQADAGFTTTEMQDLSRFFSSDGLLQNYFQELNDQYRNVDLKYGELYHEILRGVTSLKEAAADAYEIEPDQCHPNFGSDGCIDTILIAIKMRELFTGIDPVARGGVLDVSPSYSRNYNSALSKKLTFHSVPLKMPDWSFDLEPFLHALKQRQPSVVFLVTPNNPTGLPIPDDSIKRVMEKVHDNTLVVIDRTLANIDPEVSSIELLRTYRQKQLVILHSLSKYYSLPHLRIGIALYSNIAVAKEISPFLPSGLAIEGTLKATRLLVQYGPLLPSQTVISNIRTNKKLLNGYCKISRGFSCTDSSSNYCLLNPPTFLTPLQIAKELRLHGIDVMSGEEFADPLKGVVRLCYGGIPERMDKAIKKLDLLYGAPNNI